MNPYAQDIVSTLKSSWADKITGALELREGAMSTISSESSVEEIIPSALQSSEPLAAKKSIPFPATNTTTRASTGVVKPSDGGNIEPVGGEAEASKLLSERLTHLANGMLYGIKAGTALTNGFLANSSAQMKASNYEFQAKQNERSAEILLRNQKEITRAAQMDANVYRLKSAQVKSEQKVAMASSGFAVGKGVYKNTLETTDARTNYNIAAAVLKGELQNAELIRQAGEYRAQAEIARGNAEIAKRMGKAEKISGIINATAYAAASAANLYVGLEGSNGSTTFKNRMGGTSTIIHGGYTEVDI